MQKSTSRTISGTDAIRALLSERLTAAGLSQSGDQLIAQAKWAKGPGEIARDLGTGHIQLAALAMMLARAEEGRIEDALALTAFAVGRRPPPVLRAFLDALERAAERPEGPLRDGGGRPIVFVVSYPRSGNTRLMNILAGAFPGSRFTAFVNEGGYVSPYGRGSLARGPVFVKDHRLQEAYRENPVLYIARDGRDCCLSYNDFRLRRPDVDAEAIREGADSLADVLVETPELFGGWPQHMNTALDWRDEGADISIVTYDAMMAPDSFGAMAEALEAVGVELSRDLYAKGLRNAQEIETQLRTGTRSWARERIYPRGSMMDRWLETEGVSRWRALIGPSEGARIHAAGYTPALIRAGFEEDPNWWASV